MMRMQHELRRDHLFETELDLERRLAARKPGAVADAEDMGVDRHGVLAKGHVEHDIGGLAARAGSDSIPARVRGTSPPNSASSFADSAITFLALVR